MKANERIKSALRPDLESRPPSPTCFGSREREKLTVFEDKVIHLSNDLNIANHLRDTIVELIVGCGGQISSRVSNIDILICQYREGNEYRTASSEGKTVGNLPWLYHLITHNAWTSPLQRLLHYPIARGGLPGFKQYRISLSNYNGEARAYLENLAKAAGCDFTKTMKMDNTHLITAHTHSEKCDAAREWDIHMINHLWLEESYAKWQIQSVTNPRYVHFPPRTNLGEVVGQTPIDKEVLETLFFPKHSNERDVRHGDNATANLTEQGNEVGDELVNDVSRQPASKKTQTLSQRPEVFEAQTPRAIGFRVPVGTGRLVETPGAPVSEAVGKENGTPSTNGSRSAKERASARIHDLAPDIALYQKERKRVGGVVFGGRRTSDEVISNASRKRSTSMEDEDGMEDMDGQRDFKKPRKGKAPPLMRLLVTGYTRWTDDEKRYQKDKVIHDINSSM